MNCIIHAGSGVCPSFPHEATRCGFYSCIHIPRCSHSSWYYVNPLIFFRLSVNILKVTRIPFTQCPHISLPFQEFSTRCIQLHGPARSVDLYPDRPNDESLETIWHCCQPGQDPATSLAWIAFRRNKQDAVGKLKTQRCANQAPCWKAYHIRRLLWSNYSGA